MIKILVCDDNITITEQVNKLISDFERKYKIEFQVSIENSSEFILTRPEQFDIAIVDVEMPSVNGIKLSKKLKSINPDAIVIILTSFQNYLDSAMRIHVFRYLSKPIDINRFNINLKDAINEYRLISKTITITNKDEVHSIKTKDILYIENQKHGSIINTKRGLFLADKKPKELLRIIGQENCFVYSHSSILVNLQNVIDFNRKEILLRKNSSETVSTYISQRKYSNFKKAFFNFAGDLK